MAQPPTPPHHVWAQLGLLGGGYQHVTLEFTVHLDAVNDQALIGLSCQDTASGELIGIRAFAYAGDLRNPQQLATWIFAAVRSAHDCLDPF